MPDIDEGQDQTTDLSEVLEAGNSQDADTVQQTETPSEGGINPVWDPIRQELGLQFEAIKPHLLEIDKGFNKGVTEANAKYTPWKSFDEQGITPDAVTNAFTMLQKLDSNPEEVYTALGQFLQENGRLPKNAAEAAQALDDVDEDGEGETPEQKELRELREKVEGFQTYQQAQQEEQLKQQLDSKAEQEVAQEYDTFDKAHPDLDPATRQEVLNRHYMYAASGPQNIRTLDEVYAEVDAFKKSFAPRPNDLAPRLPGTGGGVPTGETKRTEELSRGESQDLLAALVANANKQS